jgi:aryl-alcohol dehydrogenase-like predicted oxidoreductase
MTWGSQNTEAEGHAQIDLALQAGVNFMDTAELYAVPGSLETSGRTEIIIGNWLKNTSKRDRWIIASKIAGGGNSFIRNGQRADGASIRIALEDSLKRLQTDYLDLYQIHWASRGSYNFDNGWSYAPHTQDTADVIDNITDMLETLGDLVREGKIRHVGVSNETTWGIAQWLRIAEKRNLPRLVSVQNEYSLIRRHLRSRPRRTQPPRRCRPAGLFAACSRVAHGKICGWTGPPRQPRRLSKGVLAPEPDLGSRCQRLCHVGQAAQP